MLSAAIKKNTGIEMYPSRSLCSLHGGWNRIDLAIFFRSKFIDLSIIFWVDNIGSLWNKNCRVSNTSDLGAQ